MYHLHQWYCSFSEIICFFPLPFFHKAVIVVIQSAISKPILCLIRTSFNFQEFLFEQPRHELSQQEACKDEFIHLQAFDGEITDEPAVPHTAVWEMTFCERNSISYLHFQFLSIYMLLLCQLRKITNFLSNCKQLYVLQLLLTDCKGCPNV